MALRLRDRVAPALQGAACAGMLLFCQGFLARAQDHSTHQLPPDSRRHSHESAGLGTVGQPARGGNIDLTTYLTTWNFSNLPTGEREKFYR